MAIRRRGYLKHYNDATMGDTISMCLMKHEPYAVILFWYIHELCNRNNSASGSVHIDILKRTFWVRKDKMLAIISNSSRLLPNLSLSYLDNNLHFFVSNYAEYQDSRSTNNSRKAHESCHIKDKRLKIKDKDTKVSSNSNEFSHTILTKLEKIYQEKYPKKIGKTKGLVRLVKEIKTEQDIIIFDQAVTQYAESVSGSDIKFIKHFSTFVSEWRDWVDFENKKQHINGTDLNHDILWNEKR